ncbi:MAG: hypothetical protein Tsb0021_09530 [Chlamydiales bacterium]
MEYINIHLDGSITSTLDWSHEKKLAEYSELKIQWLLDLGLFKDLPQSLKNPTQIQTLELALQHFEKTLWNIFQDRTQAVVVFQGSLNFASELKWDHDLLTEYKDWMEQYHIPASSKLTESLFAREVASQYLNELVSTFDEDVPCVIHLDAREINDLTLFSLLSDKHRFDWIEPIIFNPPFKQDTQANVGLCFPGNFHVAQPQLLVYQETLKSLLERKIPFRCVYEESLTNDWQGLDYILALPSAISKNGLRKLEGFCAAAGTVIPLRDEDLNLEYTMNYKTWLASLTS